MSKEFDFSGYGSQSEMEINGLSCTFHMPKALKSRLNEGGEEVAQGLPPGAPRRAFKVDEYDCPVSWMHGSGLASSYFVPIEAEHGMWLDFNKNAYHTHHVAVLLSIQGLNPLDGQSLVEIDQKVCLKQYKMKCPKHDVDFRQDRYCPECKYKWVPQNYLASNATPSGLFWLDGFLAPDGKVRQYYFTENEEMGVAHQILGAEKKVYSIGVAFYLSKEPKPKPAYVATRSLESISFNFCSAGGSYKEWAAPASAPSTKSLRTRGGIVMNDAARGLESVKSLDIGAGAMINQKVYPDPESLDFWQDKPAGLIYINYCPAEQATAILKQGKKDLTNKGEGFLGGLKVGK